MKITFEGESLTVIQMEIVDFIVAAMPGALKEAVAIRADRSGSAKQAPVPAREPEPQKAKGRKNKGGRPKKVQAVEKPVEKPVEKSAMPLSAMRDEEAMRVEKFEDMVLEPDPMEEPVSPVTDVAKLAAIRVKTTEDLQTAYASGKHKQVLELLATYGNGAKSFRELAIKDFLPIRKAIDDGALQ